MSFPLLLINKILIDFWKNFKQTNWGLRHFSCYNCSTVRLLRIFGSNECYSFHLFIQMFKQTFFKTFHLGVWIIMKIWIKIIFEYGQFKKYFFKQIFTLKYKIISQICVQFEACQGRVVSDYEAGVS